LYLADVDISSLADEMKIEGPNAAHPFEPGEQIQPCSIDLRVSNVFWMPRRRRWIARRLMPSRTSTIDLRQTNVHALNSFRDWRKVEIGEGHSVTIRPGETVMTRIYERFRMPDNCAGKIEGRSSFARLGLAVHCTGDFINPGWEGYMPLQLSNTGMLPIKIAPYFPICQLMLVSLSSSPTRTYGDKDLQSKYTNDDGGPSLWWRDARVRQLQASLAGADIPQSIQDEIVNTVRFESTTVLRRFLRYVAKRSAEKMGHADQVLQDFSAWEDFRRLVDVVVMALIPILAGAAVSAIPGVNGPLEGSALALLLALLVSLFLGYLAWERREDGYIGKPELRAKRPPGDPAR
jgi:deoxycytidine triphosphate deaminase